MSHAVGPDQILFIVGALRWTLLLTALSLLIGGAVGFAVAIGRVSQVALVRWIASGYIGVIQGVPALMLLFLAYYGLSLAGLELPPLVAASISLALYVSGYLADIWRGAIQSVPWQQWEASSSLAMTRAQQFRYVVLPQALRIATPPTVGFAVQAVKNTSIVSIVNVVEIARAGQLVNNVSYQPFRVYGLVALLYFAVCWPMSLLAARLERRLDARRKR
jgi:polar amino acid transport system permease protein